MSLGTKIAPSDLNLIHTPKIRESQDCTLNTSSLCGILVSMDIPTIIGNNLDGILTEHAIGRREFARAMKVPMSTYARMLRGVTVPFITTIYRALGAGNAVLLERGKEPIKIDKFLRGCPEYGTSSENN